MSKEYEIDTPADMELLGGVFEDEEKEAVTDEVVSEAADESRHCPRSCSRKRNAASVYARKNCNEVKRQ